MLRTGDYGNCFVFGIFPFRKSHICVYSINQFKLPFYQRSVSQHHYPQSIEFNSPVASPSCLTPLTQSVVRPLMVVEKPSLESFSQRLTLITMADRRGDSGEVTRDALSSQRKNCRPLKQKPFLFTKVSKETPVTNIKLVFIYKVGVIIPLLYFHYIILFEFLINTRFQFKKFHSPQNQESITRGNEIYLIVNMQLFLFGLDLY